MLDISRFLIDPPPVKIPRKKVVKMFGKKWHDLSKINDYKHYPKTCGVYMMIYKPLDTLLYIGSTKRVHSRIQGGIVFRSLKGTVFLKDVQILFKDFEKLPVARTVECILIREYKPFFNKMGAKSKGARTPTLFDFIHEIILPNT